MDSLPLYDLHKICRICLKNADLLVSIFSPTFMLQPIEMIEKLHIFKLDDNLPTMLCQSCLYRLLDAYNLQQLADSSKLRLQEYLNASGCAFNFNSNQEHTPQESTCFSTSALQRDTNTKDDVDADATAAIYANICEMFEERHVHTNDIEVEADDVLEIDVSSLTRSEAGDTLSDVFVATGHLSTDNFENTFVDKITNEDVPQNEHIFSMPKNKPIMPKQQKRNAKVLKVNDKCLECGKVFKYSGYLEAHKRTHTGEKPFQCKLCPRQFTQSSNLALHNRTHTGERRFQCEICSSLFTTSSNLKAHSLTHLERRDYQCACCKLSFKTLRQLRRHEPVHKTIKDVVCELCQKAFTQRSYLSAHMAAVHSGIRQHKCAECEKVFGNRSNLICHMRTHTGEKPFECKLCNWKFNQSSALHRHMRKHTTKRKNSPPAVGTFLSVLSQSPTELPTELPLIPQNSTFNLMPIATHLSDTLSPSYDFTKEDGILDFSTHAQNHHTQNLCNF